MVVTLKDGRQLTASRDYAHGTAKDPMSVDEVREKYRRLAAAKLPAEEIARLETLIDSLETATELSELTKLLRGKHRTVGGRQLH